METALRRIADMLEAFADAAAAWFATGAWRPENWPGVTWALVAALVVLSWLLAWRRRAPRTLDVRPPQLLVTSGEVVPDGAEEVGSRPSGRRRRRPAPEADAAAGAFAMTVSNLSRYPVQLLEVALRDGRRGAPRVATVDAVVPAMGSVSVSGRILLGLRGDGWLDLYCYAAAPRVKMHRHRVELVWEPWAARFKAAPLEQVSVPARRLASDEPDASFLEDEPPEAVEPVAFGAPVPARPAEPREPPMRATARPARIDERSSAAPAPVAVPKPVEPRPAVPEPVVPEPVVPEPVVRKRTMPEPVAPEPVAPEPAVPEPRSPAPRPSGPVAPAGAARSGRSVPPAPPAATRAAPEGTSASASSGGTLGHAGPDAERRGVPRIATPPVGVAVAGRGGASARTAEGLPIGRPTARPEPTAAPATEPDAPDAVAAPGPQPAPDRAPDADRGAPAPAVAPALPARRTQPARAVEIAPASAASEDESPPEPAARRRPRLEFPDEF